MIGSKLVHMAQDIFTALKSVLVKSSLKWGITKKMNFYHIILLSQPLMCYPAVVVYVCEQVRWCVRREC